MPGCHKCPQQTSANLRWFDGYAKMQFSTEYKDPDNADDVGFMLKSVDLQLAQGPIENFNVPDLDSQFKSQYLKFLRNLNSLSPTGCPHISYDGNKIIFSY